MIIMTVVILIAISILLSLLLLGKVVFLRHKACNPRSDSAVSSPEPLDRPSLKSPERILTQTPAKINKNPVQSTIKWKIETEIL